MENLQKIQLTAKCANTYFYAFQSIMGNSVIYSAYKSGFTGAFDAEYNDSRYQDFVNLNLGYYFDTSLNAKIDYLFLRILFKGMQVNYGDENLTKITKEVGAFWWFGDAPISPYQNKLSLQKIIGANILLQLDTWKFSDSNKDVQRVRTRSEMAKLALHIFTHEIKKFGEIQCSIREEDKTIIFTIDVCPFCFDQSVSCHIFLGVFTALISWLQGSFQEPDVLIINREKSTGHTIEVRVV